MKSRWDLFDLRVFCAVAQRSSFVAAAAQLDISPAYVSKRIGEFEATLGVALFRRTTRRVWITEDGEAVYARARRVLEAAEGLDEELPRSHGLPQGALRISTSLRIGRDHVSPILGRMRDAFPGLEPWLELVDRRVDVVEEGFDIDIRIGEVTDPDVVAHLVTRNARILCAAPAYLAQRGHPRSLADLASHDCLLYRERHQPFGEWRLQGPEGAETVKITGPMGSNHSDITRNWCLEGRGVLLLAVWDVAQHLREGSLVRVLPAWHQPADVWAVTATRAGSSGKLRQCLDFLVRELRSGPYALESMPV